MATKCFSVVRGKRLRATRLDGCGNPPDPGTASSMVVTKGFVTVGLTGVTEDGEEITQKNADGELCVNDRSRDEFKRWDLSIELCEVDPGLVELVTQAVLETDANDDTVGIRTPEGSATESVGLEVWSGIPGEDCSTGPEQFGYLLLPWVIPGTLGDITIENGATTFTMSAHSRAGGGWGIGPYNVVLDANGDPSQLGTPIASDEHMLLRTTGVEPPAAQCGLQDMPST